MSNKDKITDDSAIDIEEGDLDQAQGGMKIPNLFSGGGFEDPSLGKDSVFKNERILVEPKISGDMTAGIRKKK